MKLTFFSSPIASKHSAFSLTKFQPLKLLLSWSHSSRNQPKFRLWRSPLWNCTWQPGSVYTMSFRPTQNWWKGEKPATDFVPFTMSAKFIFSKRSSPALSSLLLFLDFGACLAQQNLDKTAWTDWRHENAARLLSTVQNDGNNVKFWVSLEKNFLSTFFRLKFRWLAKVSARFLSYAS